MREWLECEGMWYPGQWVVSQIPGQYHPLNHHLQGTTSIVLGQNNCPVQLMSQFKNRLCLGAKRIIDIWFFVNIRFLSPCCPFIHTSEMHIYCLTFDSNCPFYRTQVSLGSSLRVVATLIRPKFWSRLMVWISCASGNILEFHPENGSYNFTCCLCLGNNQGPISWKPQFYWKSNHPPLFISDCSMGMTW